VEIDHWMALNDSTNSQLLKVTWDQLQKQELRQRVMGNLPAIGVLKWDLPLFFFIPIVLEKVIEYCSDDLTCLYRAFCDFDETYYHAYLLFEKAWNLRRLKACNRNTDAGRPEGIAKSTELYGINVSYFKDFLAQYLRRKYEEGGWIKTHPWLKERTFFTKDNLLLRLVFESKTFCVDCFRYLPFHAHIRPNGDCIPHPDNWTFTRPTTDGMNCTGAAKKNRYFLSMGWALGNAMEERAFEGLWRGNPVYEAAKFQNAAVRCESNGWAWHEDGVKNWMEGLADKHVGANPYQVYRSALGSHITDARCFECLDKRYHMVDVPNAWGMIEEEFQKHNPWTDESGDVFRSLLQPKVLRALDSDVDLSFVEFHEKVLAVLEEDADNVHPNMAHARRVTDDFIRTLTDESAPSWLPRDKTRWGEGGTMDDFVVWEDGGFSSTHKGKSKTIKDVIRKRKKQCDQIKNETVLCTRSLLHQPKDHGTSLSCFRKEKVEMAGRKDLLDGDVQPWPWNLEQGEMEQPEALFFQYIMLKLLCMLPHKQMMMHTAHSKRIDFSCDMLRAGKLPFPKSGVDDELEDRQTDTNILQTQHGWKDLPWFHKNGVCSRMLPNFPKRVFVEDRRPYVKGEKRPTNDSPAGQKDLRNQLESRFAVKPLTDIVGLRPLFQTKWGKLKIHLDTSNYQQGAGTHLFNPYEPQKRLASRSWSAGGGWSCTPFNRADNATPFIYECDVKWLVKTFFEMVFEPARRGGQPASTLWAKFEARVSQEFFTFRVGGEPRPVGLASVAQYGYPSTFMMQTPVKAKENVTSRPNPWPYDRHIRYRLWWGCMGQDDPFSAPHVLNQYFYTPTLPLEPSVLNILTRRPEDFGWDQGCVLLNLPQIREDWAYIFGVYTSTETHRYPISVMAPNDALNAYVSGLMKSFSPLNQVRVNTLHDMAVNFEVLTELWAYLNYTHADQSYCHYANGVPEHSLFLFPTGIPISRDGKEVITLSDDETEKEEPRTPTPTILRKRKEPPGAPLARRTTKGSSFFTPSKTKKRKTDEVIENLLTKWMKRNSNEEEGDLELCVLSPEEQYRLEKDDYQSD
jgi:hypothetical protein